MMDYYIHRCDDGVEEEDHDQDEYDDELEDGDVIESDECDV